MLLSASSASAQGCDRQDLQDTVDDYIDAQQAADPIKMHMNLWVDYNEQMQNAAMSTGLLSKPKKIDFHRALLDTATCSVFVEEVTADPADPMVIGTIVNARGGAVSGLQVVWTDKANGWLFSPASTRKYSQAENWSPIPAADRDSRETLQAAADAYLDLFHDKTVKVPWGAPCARLEGGLYTSKAEPGALNPDDSCNVGIPSGVPIVDRVYVIDPELGAVAVLSHFGSDKAADFHTFRIEKGRIRYIHTITACRTANCGQTISPETQARLAR